ncbi:MAG: ATP-binding protein [Planctomycetota bacterium]|nr:ATP-binding protein [Planctomycetota bacterium]
MNHSQTVSAEMRSELETLRARVAEMEAERRAVGEDVSGRAHQPTQSPVEDQLARPDPEGETGPTGSTRHAQAEAARHRETEVAHVNRLNVMGEMAASLAHELNQPLTTIISYMGACKRMLGSEKFDRADLCTVMQSVTEQAQRAAKIIRNVRQFASKHEPIRTRVSVNEIVRNAELAIRPEACRHHIEVRLDLDDGNPELDADVIQLERLLQNLLQNAVEALAESASAPRRITIRTGIGVSRTVEIEVQDTGPGVPRKIAGTLFESFVTGKTNGLGLGLAISRTIVKSHGGQLNWSPNPDGGAVFTVSLPASTGSPE